MTSCPTVHRLTFRMTALGQVIWKFLHSQSILQIYKLSVHKPRRSPNKITGMPTLFPTFTSFFSCEPKHRSVDSWGIKQTNKKAEIVAFEKNPCNLQHNKTQFATCNLQHKTTKPKIWPFTVWQLWKSDRKSFWLLEISNSERGTNNALVFSKSSSKFLRTLRFFFCNLKCVCP